MDIPWTRPLKYKIIFSNNFIINEGNYAAEIFTRLE
jgi:hypothetical protein